MANTVNFIVKYDASFKGKKHFKDGEKIEVAKETAELFVKKKIGKIA
jgi:hypothetical protein